MGKAREGPAEKMVLEQSPGWTRGGHHAHVGGGMCAEDGTARGEACSRGQLRGLLVAMQGACWEKRCKSGVRSGACAGQEGGAAAGHPDLLRPGQNFGINSGLEAGKAVALACSTQHEPPFRGFGE